MRLQIQTKRHGLSELMNWKIFFGTILLYFVLEKIVYIEPIHSSLSSNPAGALLFLLIPSPKETIIDLILNFLKWLSVITLAGYSAIKY
jgi:hypothetical protein